MRRLAGLIYMVFQKKNTFIHKSTQKNENGAESIRLFRQQMEVEWKFENDKGIL
jgi:hypothetical protein